MIDPSIKQTGVYELLFFLLLLLLVLRRPPPLLLLLLPLLFENILIPIIPFSTPVRITCSGHRPCVQVSSVPWHQRFEAAHLDFSLSCEDARDVSCPQVRLLGAHLYMCLCVSCYGCHMGMLVAVRLIFVQSFMHSLLPPPALPPATSTHHTAFVLLLFPCRSSSCARGVSSTVFIMTHTCYMHNCVSHVGVYAVGPCDHVAGMLQVQYVVVPHTVPYTDVHTPTPLPTAHKYK